MRKGACYYLVDNTLELRLFYYTLLVLATAI